MVIVVHGYGRFLGYCNPVLKYFSDTPQSDTVKTIYDSDIGEEIIPSQKWSKKYK